MAFEAVLSPLLVSPLNFDKHGAMQLYTLRKKETLWIKYLREHSRTLETIQEEICSCILRHKKNFE